MSSRVEDQRGAGEAAPRHGSSCTPAQQQLGKAQEPLGQHERGAHVAPVHHTPMLRPATDSLRDKHPPASLSASSLRPSVSPLLVMPTALTPGRLLSRLVSSTRSEGRGA